MPPETRYARSGPVNIAYQMVGDGPPDLVAVEAISHIELDWGVPSKADRRPDPDECIAALRQEP